MLKRTRYNFLLPGTILFFCLGVSLPLFAQLERQSVIGGGTLYGTLEILSPEKNLSTVNLSETDRIVLDSDLFSQKEILRPEMIEYRLTAPLEGDTPEVHRQIAKWCEEKKMPGEAKLHFERIIELDPEDEEARKALGYEKNDGVWMTAKERREQSGYVSYGGHLVTPQEKELLQQSSQQKKLAAQWKKQVKSLQNRLRADNGDQEARDTLRSISAPEALSALTHVLRQDEDYPQNRVLYVMAMGKIGTPAALGDLAAVAIGDEDGDVRQTALEMILKHPKAVPGAVSYFIDILRHPEKFPNSSINRAGHALGVLNAESALPDLVNALVTTHTETIVIPGSQTSATFSSDGNISFNPGTSEKTKNVTQEFENQDVLNALRSIVRQFSFGSVDFGYDIDAWKGWLAEKENLNNFHTRRDD